MIKPLARRKVSRGLRYVVDTAVFQRLTRNAGGLMQERGSRMAVFANDYIASSISIFGIYEKEELELAFGFLKPLNDVFAKGTALDIGANVGNHSLFFAKIFNRILAFEPNPVTYRLLDFNLSSKNAAAFNIGLGSTKSKLNLVEDKMNNGASYISRVEQGVEVPIERLDEIARDASAIELIKIDVEGFEFDVLLGGAATIKKQQPVIILEQNRDQFDESGDTPAITTLRSWGYKFCWHEMGLEGRGLFSRRIRNLADFVLGRELRIVHGDRIPVRTHSMLIAIPPRFHGVFGI